MVESPGCETAKQLRRRIGEPRCEGVTCRFPERKRGSLADGKEDDRLICRLLKLIVE